MANASAQLPKITRSIFCFHILVLLTLIWHLIEISLPTYSRSTRFTAVDILHTRSGQGWSAH